VSFCKFSLTTRNNIFDNGCLMSSVVCLDRLCPARDRKKDSTGQDARDRRTSLGTEGKENCVSSSTLRNHSEFLVRDEQGVPHPTPRRQFLSSSSDFVGFRRKWTKNWILYFRLEPRKRSDQRKRERERVE
jgi:hypothetical protein